MEKYDWARLNHLQVLFLGSDRPGVYLVPSMAWRKPNQLLVSRDYEGKKSKPEWGLNLSWKNLPLLEQYAFDTTVAQL